MTDFVRRLDWRSEFSLLEPYFEGAGGVVHVHLPAGETSPAHAFQKVLRDELKSNKWGQEWSVVLVNPSDPATHYLSGIVRQCFRVFGISPPSNNSPLVHVGCGNEAGGDVSVSQIDVSIENDDYSVALRDDVNIDHLRAGIAELLKTRRAAIIFFNTHECADVDLSALGQRLWEGGISGLIESGMLVVDIYDPLKMNGRSTAWPAEPSLTLELSVNFSGDARAHALDDLATIAMRTGVYENETSAKVFAETVMVTSRNICDVYAGLGLAVARMGAPNAAKT